MTDLETLQEAALVSRLKGVLAGGHNILWDAKHLPQLRLGIKQLPERVLVDAVEHASAAEPVIRTPSLAPVLRAMDSSALSWLFQISNENSDLMNDSIKVGGWKLKNIGQNGPVFLNHDTKAMPIAQSSMPWVKGSSLMAIATFPAAGISAASDQARTMIAAGILRGASVGFVPGKFKFSTDPQRPMGIDFLEGHTLTEWSCVGVPANSSCLVVGPASGGAKSAGETSTREQRLAEAARFRRQAFGA